MTAEHQNDRPFFLTRWQAVAYLGGIASFWAMYAAVLLLSHWTVSVGTGLWVLLVVPMCLIFWPLVVRLSPRRVNRGHIRLAEQLEDYLRFLNIPGRIAEASRVAGVSLLVVYVSLSVLFLLDIGVLVMVSTM